MIIVSMVEICTQLQHIVFRVPVTREMVATLLDPTSKKSVFDWITLGTMAFEIALFFLLPLRTKRILFTFIFFFWRLCYNVGLGVLLKEQSDNRGLVKWAKKYKIFDREANPKIYNFLHHQLSMKMGDDYDFEVNSSTLKAKMDVLIYIIDCAYRIQYMDAVQATGGPHLNE